MSLTSKSPRMVTLAALAVGKEALRDYSHRYSPKVFTQPQLLACLVLMTFLRTDYRGLEQHLKDLPAYQEWLGLKKVPDHSTLHKAAQRFLSQGRCLRLLAASVKLTLGRCHVIHRAAADGTGLGERATAVPTSCNGGNGASNRPEIRCIRLPLTRASPSSAS